MTLDEKALQLADRALTNGFDPEAYLVKYVAEIRLNQSENTDLVEGSNVDEFIQTMLQLFVTYYNSKTVEALTNLLLVLRQVISELYHDCETQQEKDEIKKFIEVSQSIIL